MVLAELRRGTTMQIAHESDKMFIVRKKIGEENLHKILCFVIKVFQDGLKITNPANEMSASEIFEAADMLMGMNEGEYGRESLFDVIMAFKHFKANAFELYNAFSDVKLRQIMTNYLESKADFLELVNGQAGRDALKKEPLTVEQVRAEYERSMAGKPTEGQASAQERKEQDARINPNWRNDENYRAVLARRDWSQGYEIEDVPHEDVTVTEPQTAPAQ